MFRSKNIMLVVLVLFCFNKMLSQNSRFSSSICGQVVSWLTIQMDDPVVLQTAGRFVPVFTGKVNLDSGAMFDMEASLNLNGNVIFENMHVVQKGGHFKPYRVWTRYASDNFEIRGGLQKINFGSAKLFRPLMWFDSMDPRDPLQLTDGVYGLLTRYYFPNNANVWAWGLLGNKQAKGWEMFGSSQWTPELGGRLQVPLLKGETALSAHFRKIDLNNSRVESMAQDGLLNESRVGFDGKWDLGVGLWVEATVAITSENDLAIPHFQDHWNVGVDYTFPLGNGVGMTIEYLRFHAGRQLMNKQTGVHLLGSMLNYPLTITDNLSAMLYFVPSVKSTFHYVSWSKMLDNWSFYFIGYWNPVNAQLLSFQSDARSLFSGKGLQLMVAYDF